MLFPLPDGEGGMAEVEATAHHASLTHKAHMEAHIYHLHFVRTSYRNEQKEYKDEKVRETPYS